MSDTLMREFAVDIGAQLVEDHSGGIERWAVFMRDRGNLFRLALMFRWADGPVSVTIGQNPSRAGQMRDAKMLTDHTKTVSCERARRNGAGAHLMLNLFALVETDSKAFWSSAMQGVSGRNAAQRAMEFFAPRLTGSIWLMAYGGDKRAKAWADYFRGRAHDLGAADQHCLGFTADGSPRHPSRLGYAVRMQKWPAPRIAA